MSYRYAISDPHGCLDVLQQALAAIDLSGDSHLYLLGDYIPHDSYDMTTLEYVTRCGESLAFVRDFQGEHPGHVSVLPGNHELMLLDAEKRWEIEIGRSLLAWMQALPTFIETDEQIFVHAGIDEEAGYWWRWGSDPWELCGKWPATFGAFEKDIVAGHVSAAGLAGSDDFEGAYWDGQSHYYIDGATERSGRITVLRYHVECGEYDQLVVTKDEVKGPMPVRAMPASA